MDRELKRIETWLEASGMAESRLGLLACANARAIERVRNGTATIDTLRAIIDYISKNKPVCMPSNKGGRLGGRS